jgi:hypothetical protein
MRARPGQVSAKNEPLKDEHANGGCAWDRTCESPNSQPQIPPLRVFPCLALFTSEAPLLLLSRFYGAGIQILDRLTFLIR